MKTELPPYTLKRSHRKTLSIYIERDGSVTVIAPNQFSDDQVREVLITKSYQIFKQLAEWEQLNTSKTTREITNGESFLYMGRNYRLQLIEDQAIPLKLKDGYFLLKKSQKEKANIVFKEFYRLKAQDRIIQRVDYYKERMGVNPGKVKIIDLKNRWASCSKSGDLNFHWKCMMAPLTIIDYIVVHELAHLKFETHSDAFWNEVDKVIPNFHERKAWLRLNGAGMEV